MNAAPRPGAGMARPGQGGIFRLLATMRARLIAMLLVAVLPLVALAASMAWQDYRDTIDRLGQQLDLAAANGAGRMDATLGDAERWLRAVALSPAVREPPGTCDTLLGQLLRVEQPRYDDLAVVDRQGLVRCSAGMGDEATRQVRLASLLTLTPPSDSVGLVLGDPSGEPRSMLPAALRVAGEHFSGVVLATLSLEWLAQWIQKDRLMTQQAIGLIDSHGRLTPFGPAMAMAASGGVAELSRGSDAQFQFRSVPLPGGLRLLMGLSTLPQLRQAKQLLIQRLSLLGTLLVAGLFVVTAAVNGAVVQPVRQLSAAVARWREGGGFEPGPLGGAPWEIAALSLSFGRAVTALNQREVQLREATTQQELLMQEIHHRVKNNLQIVASLLNLQASRIKLPEARAEFQAARDRIRALATLHRHLYAYGELHTINMRSFLIELCGQLLQALGETPARGRIKLDIEAPELRISSDQAVPMALIVTEAVSNAAKYAFPGGRSGHIEVRLTIIGEGAAEMLRLTIEDDGVGISSGRAETAEGVRDGIGTRLIRGFARQLQATLTLTHDGGTRYMLDIPLHRKRAETAPEPMSEA